MAGKRRNILFITADQWRGECLSILNHVCVKTPNLDALARDGAVFSAHYCQAAPCSPARASLLTGLYQKKHRVLRNGTPLDDRHTNVALEARKAGYDPTLFGYTDQTLDHREHAEDDPRTLTYEGVIPGFSVGVQIQSEQYPYLNWLRAKGVDVPEGAYGVYLPAREEDRTNRPNSAPPIFTADQTESVFIGEKFREFVGDQGDASWFAHLSILSPHPPFIVPEPYNRMIDPADTPKPVRAASPEEEGGDHPYHAWELSKRGAASFHKCWDGLGKDFTEDDVAKMRATYYGMMAEVDAQLGKIFDHLKSIGQYEDTMIVFTSDHAEMLGDHYGLGKFGYFDQSYRIPLIIHAPGSGLKPGQIVDEFSEAVDVMPTILDWIGLDAPDDCDGQSLLPFTRGEVPEVWRDEVVWEYNFGVVEDPSVERHFGLSLDDCQLSVIRDRAFKYVHFNGLPSMLFDLEKDPDNFENKIDDPAYTAKALEYAQKMLRWHSRHNDQTLTRYHVGDNQRYYRERG